MTRCVCFLGAHYDDVEIGVGGILYRHLLAKDTTYIVVTSADEIRTGDPAMRLEEQHAAIREMWTALSIPGLKTYDNKDQISDIIAGIDKLKPTDLYIPFRQDTHQDHARCNTIGMAVGRRKNINIFYYDSGTAYGFIPNMFVPIDFDKKMSIVACFKSQIENGSIVVDMCKHREAHMGFLADRTGEYMEGIMVHRFRYEI